MKARKLYIAAAAAIAMIAGSAQAAIQVAGTRIVFDGAQKEQTVRLTNTDDAPILAQLWLDSGKEDTDDAVAGAESARREWSEMPAEHRAAVFLKAAELLSGPWPGMNTVSLPIGQSRCVMLAIKVS